MELRRSWLCEQRGTSELEWRAQTAEGTSAAAAVERRVSCDGGAREMGGAAAVRSSWWWKAVTVTRASGRRDRGCCRAPVGLWLREEGAACGRKMGSGGGDGASAAASGLEWKHRGSARCEVDGWLVLCARREVAA